MSSPQSDREIERIWQAVDKNEVHRCPRCGTPFAVGRLGEGAILEVQCQRDRCKDRSGTRTKFLVANLNTSGVSIAPK